MSDIEEVRQVLLENIKIRAAATKSSSTLLALAEAYAWVVAPDNSHGGGESG